VTLSAVTNHDVTVAYTTLNATAQAPTDYTSKSGTARIVAGATSTEISVPVKGDTTVEPTESLTVRISSPVGATIGRTNGAAKILNDD
jgi:hypothetical protein